MENLLKIVPLALLLIAAVVVVLRGLRHRTHDKGRIKGGGPDFEERNH